MNAEVQIRLQRLLERIPALAAGQIYWLDRVVEAFAGPHTFQVLRSDIFDASTLQDFGDALRVHHCFSSEPFSKDKFEFVLESVVNMGGKEAILSPRGNRGHDITIDGCAISLKTQADKGIRTDKIWISKFMELGKGHWGDKLSDLEGLRQNFLDHLRSYERIIVLRALQRGPEWHYELVEVPKKLLTAAATGTLEMKTDSKQYPKPGYCHVRSAEGDLLYQLYFDAGSERKLQVKNLVKSQCSVHADWQFLIAPAQD